MTIDADRRIAAQGHPTVGSGPGADGGPTAVGAESVEQRREAVAELGAAVRALVDAAVRANVPSSVLTEVARQLTAFVPPLAAAQRRAGDPPLTDDPRSLIWFYNLVVGPGNPLAPPLRLEVGVGEVTARGRLGMAHEGPRGMVHGGVSAMLLDNVLGDTLNSTGSGGVTHSLRTRYRRPVPIDTDLVVRGWIGEVDGDRVTLRGTIARADEPDRPLVEAEGLFVRLNPQQRRRMFPSEADPQQVT